MDVALLMLMCGVVVWLAKSTCFARGSHTYGVYGAPLETLGRAAAALSMPLFRLAARMCGIVQMDSEPAQRLLQEGRAALARGETVYVVGMTAASHNAGLGLVEVKPSGMELLCNLEEERFTGRKHDPGFPMQSVEELRKVMEARGIAPEKVVAIVGSWDYISYAANQLGHSISFFPHSLSVLKPAVKKQLAESMDFVQGRTMGPRLARELGCPGRPLVALRHHDNHAISSFLLSPFAGDAELTMVFVSDGQGDDSAMSLYAARGPNEVRLLEQNNNFYDSLGYLYSVISSTQGGWTALSSEGRYMGAAAWGDRERLANRYYRELRQTVYFGPGGSVRLNLAFANWVRDLSEPYGPDLEAVVGPAIPHSRMFNPDAVMCVDDVQHAPITRQRVDKAAALQMVFEDAVCHIVGHLIEVTGGAERLIWTGGSALNGAASMRLMEVFNEEFYDHRMYGEGKRLRLWIPPFPGDAGVAAGAAMNFGLKCLPELKATARAHPVMTHAFYCGARGPTLSEVMEVCSGPGSGFAHRIVCGAECGLPSSDAADLLAYLLSCDAVVGLFQGPAETGPRALGHRTILANPTNPRSLEVLNARVKARERVRPLAPMVLQEEAERMFVLEKGAAAAGYNAYNYMVVTTRARPEAREKVPAVVHVDGTSRIQIVRQETDRFTHALLLALRRYIGVGVCVNTSLNVGTPIAQTPSQALTALSRAKAMHGVFFLCEGGEGVLIWETKREGLKDGGDQLLTWIGQWEATRTQGR